ncbi:hypothetical protein KH5H1_37210 [Corallococcus caeni]|uniref:hypothetical protein n=1 Tax=Corallococcus caeni TaxID=3082388 RepID=UPI0029562840|nr:hypothetical protein KH5H1_37210 [Corallococcus sp. KH5-1]
MTDDTWIITAYFNPCRYATKKLNFDIFAARLKASQAKLLVIEMALDDREFELGNDHDVIRVRGDGVMWQKERLLNLASAQLPASCTKVAWLDCDLLFEDDEWLRQTSAALDSHVVVQPFSHCVRLPRGHLEFRSVGQEEEQITESFAAVYARDPSLARDVTFRLHGHTGYAWAARREFLDACGLYDACLTGSGDHLMAHVFAGAPDSPCITATLGSGRYAEHFARWTEDAHRIVGGRLGHVPGCVLHLWHGTIADRRYHQRNQELKAFTFDPMHHLRRDANGLWAWGDAPAELRAWATELFASRNEDGHCGLDGRAAG